MTRWLRWATALGLVAPIVLAPVIVHGMSASASSGTSDGVISAGKFTPTVVNPAYQASVDPNPYAYYVRPVIAWRQRLIYTLDAVNGAPTMAAVYNVDTLKPKNPKGLRLHDVVQSYVADSRTGNLLVTEGGAASKLMQIVGPGTSPPISKASFSFGPYGLRDPAQRVGGMARGGA